MVPVVVDDTCADHGKKSFQVSAGKPLFNVITSCHMQHHTSAAWPPLFVLRKPAASCGVFLLT
jgi:hypothetical protein